MQESALEGVEDSVNVEEHNFHFMSDRRLALVQGVVDLSLELSQRLLELVIDGGQNSHPDSVSDHLLHLCADQVLVFLHPFIDRCVNSGL